MALGCGLGWLQDGAGTHYSILFHSDFVFFAGVGLTKPMYLNMLCFNLTLGLTSCPFSGLQGQKWHCQPQLPAEFARKGGAE